MCAERHTEAAHGAGLTAEHAALRTQLVQRLAGRGEPLFTSGARSLPAAALFAGRHTRVAFPTDRIDALVNVVAALWEHGAATAHEIACLAPRAVGGACASGLALHLARRAAAAAADAAEFDADAWLRTTDSTGDAIVFELLFGARLVLLESAWQRAPHAPAARAIF